VFGTAHPTTSLTTLNFKFELDSEETAAQYTDTLVSGTTTLDITCGGDATNQQRAILVIKNSAGQTDNNTSQGLSSDGQRQTAGVTLFVDGLHSLRQE